MPIEMHDGAPWIFKRRSCGNLPETPLHETLFWILEQLSFWHFVIERDANGDGVSLTLGRAAAEERRLKDLDAAHQVAEARTYAIVLNGILAKGRERGVTPDEEVFSNAGNALVRDDANGRMNTEFHYAVELVSLLRGITVDTHRFDSLPIFGRADLRVVEMLGEATRCLMLGLVRSSVAVCRACLEAALKSAVPQEVIWDEQERYRRPDGKIRGEFECLINVAGRRAVLDPPLRDAARKVRTTGNRAAHGDAIGEDAGWETLERTRQVVEYIYRPGGPRLTATSNEG